MSDNEIIECPHCKNDDKSMIEKQFSKIVAPGIKQIWFFCSSCSKSWSTTQQSE